MDKKTWTAEQTAHPHAKADRWALIYDATPGGRDNGDGTRSYALRFPALLLSDLVNDPENVAKEVAAELNSVGPLRAERDAARARAEAAEARVLELEALHAEDMGLCAQMQADEDAARAEVERLREAANIAATIANGALDPTAREPSLRCDLVRVRDTLRAALPTEGGE
jgi:hypothetical protein